MDCIIIRGLRFYGRHGVLEIERKQPQPFVVHLELEYDLSIAGNSDRLEDTVDYALVCAVVQAIVEGNSYCLIEKLAEKIASALLEAFPISALSVEVEKPEAPVVADFTNIAIRIHRIRQ